MASQNFRNQLIALMDKHEVELCVHEFNVGQQIELTVYRIIKKDEDRELPIPEAVLMELSPLVCKEYFPEAVISNPFKISPTGLTNVEMINRQRAWNSHCKLSTIGT